MKKFLNFLKRHKGKVIGFILFIIGLFIGSKVEEKRNRDSYVEIDEIDYDPGRDCKMTFMVDDDTKEVLGEVPCSESYAKDMLDYFSKTNV